MMTDDAGQAWLLGELDSRSSATRSTRSYARSTRPAGASDVRRQTSRLRTSRRPVRSTRGRGLVTCPACGDTLVRTGQAVLVPRRVAHDASVYYWRNRNETSLLNRNVLNQRAGVVA